jgi:hypothetical protein
MEKPLVLRSPFNGERIVVPPEINASMLEAMIKAGFTVEEDEPPPPPRKNERIKYGNSQG